jgi:hypothetical protein
MYSHCLQRTDDPRSSKEVGGWVKKQKIKKSSMKRIASDRKSSRSGIQWKNASMRWMQEENEHVT